MSDQSPLIATYRGSSGGSDQREWNLALAFQEVLTVIVRVRFGRQPVQNAEAFRPTSKSHLESRPRMRWRAATPRKMFSWRNTRSWLSSMSQ